jgi:hypothetical protein
MKSMLQRLAAASRLLCVFGLFLVANQATTFADPITVIFEGTITTQLGNTWTQPGFAVGQRFVGVYVFESTTPGNPSATNFGGIPPDRMPYPGTLLSFTVTSGGNTLTSSGSLQNGILVDWGLIDSYLVILNSFESELYIDLRSSNQSLFTSPALPTSLPPVAAFDQSAFFRARTIGGEGGFAWAQGNIDRITVVPEPGTLVLLGSGGFGLGAARWLRKRRSKRR